MDAHLAKPIDRETLYETLGRWLPARGSEGPTPAPSERRLPAAAADLPAHLEGFDVDRGLGFADQDSALYRRLLLLLKDQLSKNAPDILHALETRDLETLGRLAHTLKGSAGMAGATRLSASASAIERAIKNGEEVTAPLSQALRAALSEAQQGLATIQPGIRSATPPSADAGREALETLLKRLRKSELVEDALLAAAADYLDHCLGAAASVGLRQAIERFQHQDAAAELITLADRAGITLN
jgi:HPt (histidine-containing phosphotransfer) domain-containing protein